MLVRIVLFAVALALGLPCAADEALPARVQAVKDYLLNEEYPEVFGEMSYRLRVDDIVIADLDDDGVDDVILQVQPHYRQSPTIVIFRVSDDLEVTRVREGLAPGPLAPVSGDYLDSHALGMGVDMTFDDVEGQPRKRQAFVQAATRRMGGVVAYRNFFHTDGRKGKGVYVDMSHIEPPTQANCENFQFSRVDAIRVLRKDDGSGNYLLAWVGTDVYIYKIRGITADGFLEKSLTVERAN